MKAVGVTCNSDHALEETRPDLIIFDVDTATSDSKTALVRLLDLDPAPAVIILSEQGDAPMLRELASYSSSYNLVLKKGHLDNGDLFVTARKLVDRDIFGVDKYLRFGSVIHTSQLSSSHEKNTMLTRLERFLEELQCESRYISDLTNVADEFISNAFFHAPVDSGVRLYSHESRRQVITLPASTQTTFEFGTDGRYVALACRDPFGSLLVDGLLERIADCAEAKLASISDEPGGAGLGLYTSYRSLDHFVINLEPDVATEFLGIVDVSNPYRDHVRLPRSLNVFTLNPFSD